jgi:HAD superfamily hydrolase (TIGR01549 family)
VGFDVDHTLLFDNKLELVAMLRLLQRMVDEGGCTLENIPKEIEAIDDLLAKQRSGRCTIDEAVETFVSERGVSDPEPYALAFRKIALRMVGSFVVPDPYARRVLEELQSHGIPVAILSNGWNPLQRAKSRVAGFDGTVLVSADLGTQKPHPEAFAALAETLGVPPERCMYVGDDPFSDAAGALRAGMQAVWLDVEGRAYPSDLPPPTHVVRALREVPGVIRSAVYS